MALPGASEAHADTYSPAKGGVKRIALRWKHALARRDRHGLDHMIFLPADADRGTEHSIERNYNEAALDYARALAQGVADPSALHEVYTIGVHPPILRQHWQMR